MGLSDELSVPEGLDTACAPHLKALLLQASARLIDTSPLQQRREEQQLKQLLLQDDETATEVLPEAEVYNAAEGSNVEETVEQQLQQERLQQQRERARKLRFAQLCRSLSLPSCSSSGAATSFYAPGNAQLLQPLCRPVQQLQEAAAAFAAVVEDHPALQGLLLLSQRVASLSLRDTSAAEALAALEGLLDRAAAWQKTMDRHHLAHLISLHCSQSAPAAVGAAADEQQQQGSRGERDATQEPAKDSARRSSKISMVSMEQQERLSMEVAQKMLQRLDRAVAAVERQVLLLRRRQLLEWRFLREFREARMQQQSLHFAPFLWALLPDDGDKAKPPQAAATAAAAALATAAAAAGGNVFSQGEGQQSLAGVVLLELIAAAPVAVTEVLLSFLRTSPLGQFEGRLRCMEAASQCRRMLLLAAEAADKSVSSVVKSSLNAAAEAGVEKSDNGAAAAAPTDGAAVVSVAMGAVARFAVAAGWQRAVQHQLLRSRKEMDREVGALASLARWNLSSRAAMKECVCLYLF